MSILTEAEELIHTDRQAQYGHPLDTYSRTADLSSAALKEKLISPLTAEDVITILALMKIARQQMRPKRDNLVDAAGYIGCLEMVAEERERRKLLRRVGSLSPTAREPVASRPRD